MKRSAAVFLLLMLLFTACVRQPAPEPPAPIPPRAAVTGPHLQLAAPSPGDTVAIIQTSIGIIRVRLFPGYAPAVVTSFTGLSTRGDYIDNHFHRAVNGFVIQGGDITGDGSPGQSVWGRQIPQELCDDLRHFAGALCLAQSGPLGGSQFYIVAAAQGNLNEAALQKLRDAGWDEEIIESYAAAGGLPYLDYTDTVFGQVYEGMDIVDAIATTPTGDDDAPQEEILILNISVQTYEG